MSVFRKIFGSNSDKSKTELEKKEQRRFLPDKDSPIDEKFTINFKNNGGKFLYSETNDEIQNNLNKIIKENNWSDKTALIFNQRLKEKFKRFDFDTTTKIEEADFLFTTCEYLIARDGSLLISSNQIAEKKLAELPKDFIVFATTSQFVETISAGLQGIKAQNKKNIPSNITTIKHFKDEETTNFLSYGSSSKNLYLLLLEDL
ncbi:lactate utilization protein [Flavobacteriaceae bacterium]|nr:lactate utilization protein [Flavobacteriaceae bacterium]